MSVDKIYRYYLYNIHTIINKLGFKYHFSSIDRFRIINFQEPLSEDFNIISNPYLLNYQENKLKLAEDILENGMYFPFFGGRLSNQLNPSLYFLLLGKHRVYSLKTYRNLIGVEKKFLFIDYPIDVQYYRSGYNIDKLDEPMQLYDYILGVGVYKRRVFTYTEIIDLLDVYGHNLSKYIHSIRKTEYISSHFILNEELSFVEFMNKPFSIKLEDVPSGD